MIQRLISTMALFCFLGGIANANAELPTDDQICSRACETKQAKDLKEIDKNREKDLAENAKLYSERKKDLVTFLTHERQINEGYKKKRDDQLLNGKALCMKKCKEKKLFTLYGDCEKEREINEQEGSDFFSEQRRIVLDDKSLNSEMRSAALEDIKLQDGFWRADTEKVYDQCIKEKDNSFILSRSNVETSGTEQVVKVESAVAIDSSSSEISEPAGLSHETSQVSNSAISFISSQPTLE